MASGRSIPPDCAEKHKGRLTPGSRIRDLPESAEKHKGSRLDTTSKSISSRFLENTSSTS